MSGNDTYAIYLYADGLMQWITTDPIQFGAINGFGGEAAAIVGYSFPSNRFQLPGSWTCSVIHMASRSNVNVPGMFIIAMDGRAPEIGKLDFSLPACSASYFFFARVNL